MGFTGPEAGLLQQFGVGQNERGNINAEYDKFTTDFEGVFACGDARRGQHLLVRAIDDGFALPVK